MADPRPPADPVLDIRVRWRAGKVLLGLAGTLTLVALVRPLAPWSPDWLKAGDALLIGLGVTSAAGRIGAGLDVDRAARPIRPMERIHVVGAAGAGAARRPSSRRMQEPW